MDEQIYYLAEEIRKGIQEITGESVTEWSGDFQLIMDLAAAYMSAALVYDNSYLLNFHAGLTCQQMKQIVSEAANRLGYTTHIQEKNGQKTDFQTEIDRLDYRYTAAYLEAIDAFEY